MGEDEQVRVIEEIYDAFGRGDAGAALDLARGALEKEDDDPVLHFLAGKAWIELDRPEEAASELGRAVDLDGDDPEFVASFAYALFRACRFDEAAARARRAVKLDASLPEAHEALALVLEREGRFREADVELDHVARLDPGGSRTPVRVSREEFEREVVRAGDRLPKSFRTHLAAVTVTVEDIPSEEILRDQDPPLDPELLGLFVGTSLPERSHLGPGGDLPPRILLFQRNLERFATDREDLREEIAVTLYHELGHYLGFDEEELGELDLG